MRDAIAAATEGVDVLLLPGLPLSHPDHVWLGRALRATPLGCRRLGLYVEQPYARSSEKEQVPPWVEDALGAAPVFGTVSAGVRDRLAKWRAIRCYRSQLPLLAMRRSLRRGAHTLVFGERVAWIVRDDGRHDSVGSRRS